MIVSTKDQTLAHKDYFVVTSQQRGSTFIIYFSVTANKEKNLDNVLDLFPT